MSQHSQPLSAQRLREGEIPRRLLRIYEALGVFDAEEEHAEGQQAGKTAEGPTSTSEKDS